MTEKQRPHLSCLRTLPSDYRKLPASGCRQQARFLGCLGSSHRMRGRSCMHREATARAHATVLSCTAILTSLLPALPADTQQQARPAPLWSSGLPAAAAAAAAQTVEEHAANGAAGTVGAAATAGSVGPAARAGAAALWSEGLSELGDREAGRHDLCLQLQLGELLGSLLPIWISGASSVFGVKKSCMRGGARQSREARARGLRPYQWVRRDEDPGKHGGIEELQQQQQQQQALYTDADEITHVLLCPPEQPQDQQAAGATAGLSPPSYCWAGSTAGQQQAADMLQQPSMPGGPLAEAFATAAWSAAAAATTADAACNSVGGPAHSALAHLPMGFEAVAAAGKLAERLGTHSLQRGSLAGGSLIRGPFQADGARASREEAGKPLPHRGDRSPPAGPAADDCSLAQAPVPGRPEQGQLAAFGVAVEAALPQLSAGDREGLLGLKPGPVSLPGVEPCSKSSSSWDHPGALGALPVGPTEGEPPWLCGGRAGKGAEVLSAAAGMCLLKGEAWPAQVSGGRLFPEELPRAGGGDGVSGEEPSARGLLVVHDEGPPCGFMKRGELLPHTQAPESDQGASFSSAWETCGLYPLTPTLSPGSLLQSESDRLAWRTPLTNSVIAANSSPPYTAAAAAAAGVRRGGQELQDEISGHQSVSDVAAACCCPRAPGRSWGGVTEESEQSYESFLLAQLAQCGGQRGSEASSLSPADLPRSSSGEDEGLLSPPGDAEACESLGPCVPPVVCWAHQLQLPPPGGPVSVWYTLGRLQPRPRRLSEHHCCFSWGAAARRRRRSCCPRAFAAAASAASSACCYSNARGAPFAPRHNFPCGCLACGQQYPHDFGPGAHAPWPGGCGGFSCRSASQQFQQQQHCSASYVGRPAGTLPSLLVKGERGGGGEVCRRHSVHAGNSCCCSRRCNRSLRLAGPPVLWSCKDSRELRSCHRPNAVHPEASRRGPEASCCSCPAVAGEPSQQPCAAATAAGGSNTAHCCVSHLGAFNQPSQASCSSMAATAAAAASYETRGRRDSWRAQHWQPGGWGGSPLFLSGLRDRRGEGDSTGDHPGGDRSQHQLGGSPDAALCCLGSRRPSRSCTSYTTVCSSLSPSRGLGIGSSSSSASATSSQPALSPQTPASFSSLILKPAEAHLELDKQAAGETPEETADTTTEIPAETPAQFESSKEGALLESKPRLADHERDTGQQQQQSGNAHKCPCYFLVGDSCACSRQRQNASSSIRSNKSSSFDGPSKMSLAPPGSDTCERPENPSLAAARSWGWCQECGCEPPLRRRAVYSVEAPASAAQLLQLDACSPAFTAVRPLTESSTVADSPEGNRGETPDEGFSAAGRKGDPFFAAFEATAGPYEGLQWLAAPASATGAGGGAAAAACPPCVPPVPRGVGEPGNPYIPKLNVSGEALRVAPATEAASFAGRPCVPLSAASELPKGRGSGEEADEGPAGVASEAALLREAMQLHGKQVDPRQPQTTEESAHRAALPQSHAGGLGEATSEPQGPARTATTRNDLMTAPSKLVDGGSLPGCEVSTAHKGAVGPFGANWEAGDMLLPGMQQDRETEETFVPLEDPGGPGEGVAAGCEGDADSSVRGGLMEPNSNPREAFLPPALLSGSGVPPCHEHTTISTNTGGDRPPPSPNKWLGGHAHASANIDASRLGAATVHPLPLQDAGGAGPPSQGLPVPTSGSGTEGPGGPLLDPSSCLLSLDGVKPDAGLGDGAATQLMTGACGELGSAGGGAGVGGSVEPPYKRKPGGGGCCLPPATTGPRIAGLQPRPPPPRVYHVVMCTRRYWRVEWVSPETGRRVYKHFGENRYGGGDRAREVAVKFWAEVRKRSADGVERGEWQGLTEVTRRVREEGVEGILEEVRTPPPLTHAQQHPPPATGPAAAQNQSGPNAAACINDSTLSPQLTAASATEQQPLQQQGTPLGSSGDRASSPPAEGGLGVSEQQQQEDHAAASAADGFRQRSVPLRASTRGRLREAAKETPSNCSSMMSQQQPAPSAQGEDDQTIQDGEGQPALKLHDKEAPGGQQQAALHHQPQQQHIGRNSYPPIDCFRGTQGPTNYSPRQQQQQASGELSEHSCVAPMQQQQGCASRGLETQGAALQLAEGPPPPAQGGTPASLMSSTSGVETAAHAGVSTGRSEWGVVQQQVLSQPPSVSPQVPLYRQPLGGLPSSSSRLWGPSTGDSGAEPSLPHQLPEDLGSMKAGGGEPGAHRREAGGEECCSSRRGSVESAAKRYRAAGPSEVVLSETTPPWVASEHAWPKSSNSSSGGNGSVPLLHAPAGPEHGGGMQLESPHGAAGALAQGDYRLAASGGEACTPVSLSTGSTQVPSSDTSRTHWTSCSIDTPASLGSVMSPLAFHDVPLGTGGGAGGGAPNGGLSPCHVMQDYSNHSGAAAGLAPSFSASSSTAFAPCDLQLALQQQQQQQLAPQQGPTPTSLDSFPMQFLPDPVYGQQQQRAGLVRTPGVRTPTPGSAVSSSRRSRCSGSSSSRKGASGGSGRSGGGGGGGSHGTRTLGRIYSLLVRGVRCWRAEWHDRTSGHRKTRQYAAPKHGEQQARALCLQALCQARSVPAQLLKEAQQTFAYEPTLSPDEASEVGEPHDNGGGGGGGPGAPHSNMPYLVQPRQQQQRASTATPFLQGTAAGSAAAACLDPSGQLIPAPLQHGEPDFNATSSGYAQPAGYFWPSAGFNNSVSPFATGFVEHPAGPPLLGALDQPAYAQNLPQDPLQQQHQQHAAVGLLGPAPAGTSGCGPPESSSSRLIRGSPASNVGHHSSSSSTGFPLDGNAATDLSPPAFGDSNNYGGVKVAPHAAAAAATAAAGGSTCGLPVSGMVAPDDVVGVKQEPQRAATHADTAPLYTSEASAEGPATPAPLSASSSSALTSTFY
ncbi:hypothetical protein ACSSS7_004717 [Eimeria intestinalis]